MTLVELLVVLAILAVVTTVAVTSSDVVLSQGRHDTTTRTLRAIQEAVLGPQSATAQSDEPAAGFLADLGRLPRKVTEGTLEGIGLAELWANPGTMENFAILRSSADAEVAVGCGWRGPYMRLPVGRGNLLDGWGRAFDLLDADGNAVADGHEIYAVRSRGPDAIAGTDDDLTVVLSAGASISVGGTVYVLDSDGQRQIPTSGSNVRVILYHPDGDTGLLAGTLLANVTATGAAVTYNSTTTAGPRYLRAYLGDPTTKPPRSNVVRIQHGGVVDLDIRSTD